MAWRPVSPLALAAALLLVGIAGLYAWLIHDQGGEGLAASGPRLVIALLAAAAAGALTGAVAPSARVRAAVLAATAALVLGLAAVAIFSIGVLLAVPGVLAFLAAVRAADELESRLSKLTGPLAVVGAFAVFWAAVLLA